VFTREILETFAMSFFFKCVTKVTLCRNSQNFLATFFLSFFVFVVTRWFTMRLFFVFHKTKKPPRSHSSMTASLDPSF